MWLLSKQIREKFLQNLSDVSQSLEGTNLPWDAT